MFLGVQQEVRAGDAGFKWGHGSAAHRNKRETSIGGHMYIRKEESGKEVHRETGEVRARFRQQAN